MRGLTQIVLFTFLTTTLTLDQKNSDEGRPYEFGFTIDGQQHRHEKKDDKGIVQGEFGFITADGIYHVTVYATDENGKFKILSMRNLRISAPLDGSPFKGEISPEANKYRKQANLSPLLPPQAAPNPLALAESPPQQALVTTPKPEQFKFTTQPTIKPACAGCGYVTTQKPVPGQSPFKPFEPLFQTQSQQSSLPQQPSGLENNQFLPGQYQNTQNALSGNTGNLSPVNQYQNPGQIVSPGNNQYQAGFVPQNVQDSQNFVEGTQNSQPPQTSSVGIPQSGLPPYQSVSGPQNTNYKPFGGIQSTQYPSGGQNVEHSPGNSQGTVFPSNESGGDGTQFSSGVSGGQNVQFTGEGGEGTQFTSGGENVQSGGGGTQYTLSVSEGQNIQFTGEGGQGTQFTSGGKNVQSGGDGTQYTSGVSGEQNVQLVGEGGQSPQLTSGGQNVHNTGASAHNSGDGAPDIGGSISNQNVGGEVVGSGNFGRENGQGGFNNVGSSLISGSGFGGSSSVEGNYPSGNGGQHNLGGGGSVGGFNAGNNVIGGSSFGNGPVQGNVPNNYQQPGFPRPNPLQIPGQGPTNAVSTLPPIAISDGVIHVGGDKKQDIPIRDKFPGMQDGLPEGIEEKDITDLLYKFHYTVGFHGHYEKGLKNGAKIGGYFVNGRDGISRVVTYIADENGYRAKVKFINLGLESDETPKPETEKTFGLKSFEFVWYPI